MTRPADQARGADSLALRLQRLPMPLQVLAVAAVAAVEAEGRLFTTARVVALYRELRLPPPKNVSTYLNRHLTAGRLMRPSPSSWAFTPEGDHYVSIEAAHVPPSRVAAGLYAGFGTVLAETAQPVLPPLLAPAGTERGLTRLLSTSPFEANVMLITRFPAGPGDPFAALVSRLRNVCASHGVRLQLASDGNAEDTLWANVVTYMWGSKYAIVIVDSLDGVLNSNVLMEVGGMLMTGRRCAILKDLSVPSMPTDLVGHIYKPVDLSDHAFVEEVIHRWLRDDLGLGACADCPTQEIR